ncbi:MAG TPA: hypothetical protein VF341_12550, partial [Anaeromyxobacteraceae bacterium]
MHVRSAFALVAVTLAAPAFAAEQAPQEQTAAATEVATPTQLAALPRLAPLLRDAQGANDASGGGTILMSALYGGLAGAVIGGGVGLLEGANYGRDIAVGAGAG